MKGKGKDFDLLFLPGRPLIRGTSKGILRKPRNQRLNFSQLLEAKKVEESLASRWEMGDTKGERERREKECRISFVIPGPFQGYHKLFLAAAKKVCSEF